MKIHYLYIVLFLFATQSCDSDTETQNSKSTEIELSQENLDLKSKSVISKIMQPSEFNLKLNGNEKWQIDSVSFSKLMKVKQQIYVISGSIENYSEESFIAIGSEISTFLVGMNTEKKVETDSILNNVIQHAQSQCDIMMVGKLQDSQIAMVNLSILFDEIPKYFQPIK